MEKETEAPSSSGSAAPAPQLRVPFFRNKKSNVSSIRKRREEDEAEEVVKNDGASESGEESDVSSCGMEGPTEQIRIRLAEKRKQLRGRRLVHTTSKKRRQELEDLEDTSSEEEQEEEHSGGNSKFDPHVKFASSGAQKAGPSDLGATARTEIDTDYTRDSQSQFERVQEILRKERREREAKLAIEEEERKKYGERAKKARDAQEGNSAKPKIYRGMAVYGAKEKEDTIRGNASSGLNRLGPIRATQYMRASVRWDYAPDICKDYKETGYCTFGDSCKFMHDRTDYKHGWEIEKDWQEGKLKEAKDDEYLVSSEAEGGSDDDKLPHSCYICRERFRQPVVTKCKHYFCEECALQHYQKSKKCAVCGEKTDGLFNTARDIIAKMKARDEAKVKGQQESDEDGQDIEKLKAVELPMEQEKEADNCD